MAALVVNRIAPSFGTGDGAAAADVGGGGGGGWWRSSRRWRRTWPNSNGVAAREEAASYAGLAAQVAPAPVGRIPLFGQDVHELAGLQRTADCLFG